MNATGRTVGPISVDEVLDRLKLLMRNAPGEPLPADETLIAIDPAGHIVGIAKGTASEVALPREFDERLHQRGAHLILIHNHPQGASLSGGDFGQLAKPGVAAVAAIGHDGSLYAASAGPEYGANRFEDRLYPQAQGIVTTLLRIERPSGRVPQSMLDAHFEHLVALVLHNARAIQYRADLGASRRYSYSECGRLCRYVTEMGGGQLRAAIRRSRTLAR